jgi:hypothetical protein
MRVLKSEKTSMGIRIRNWIRIHRIRMFLGLPDPDWNNAWQNSILTQIKKKIIFKTEDDVPVDKS